MSGAIASSSAAFLFLPSPASSPQRRRSRVSSAVRSYGAADARLHWARRGFSRDGVTPCAATASSPGAGGEEDAAKAAEAAAGERSKVITGQLGKAAENEGAASPKSAASAPNLDSTVAEQNGAAVSKSKVDPSIHTQVSESATASGYWKDFVVGEQVGAKVDTSGDVEVPSSSDNSGNKGSSPLAGPNVMNVIVVASECAPFCKTGGLGDVVGALPKALARRGHRVMVVIPKYGDYAEARDLGVHKRYKVAGQDSEVTYFHSYIDGVDFVFLEAPPFRHRHNDIYGGERPDVLKRMILFCKAAVEVPWYAPCGGTVYGDGNLVFIANDWHTALLPVYLKAYYRDNGLMQYTRSVLVMHNIAHQGRGPVEDFFNMDLPAHYMDHFKLYDPAGGEHSNVFAAGLKMV